jgi:hypothetical protein
LTAESDMRVTSAVVLSLTALLAANLVGCGGSGADDPINPFQGAFSGQWVDNSFTVTCRNQTTGQLVPGFLITDNGTWSVVIDRNGVLTGTLASLETVTAGQITGNINRFDGTVSGTMTFPGSPTVLTMRGTLSQGALGILQGFSGSTTTGTPVHTVNLAATVTTDSTCGQTTP